ncbi:MAG: magnesium/cobalt transporter CorA [Burkholderiales bacterium]
MDTKNMIVNCAAYSKGRRMCDITIEEISDILEQESAFVWLGLYEPDEELLKKVQEEFALHDLAVEDAHRAHQRPKLERYGDSLFIVLHTAQMADEEIEFGETHVFVGPRYVVTVRHGASLSYVPVRQRCEASPHLLRKGPAFALYAIMDFVVDNYLPIVESFEERLEGLEEHIFAGSTKRDATREIYDLKSNLMRLRRAVSPLSEICSQLMRFDVKLIPDEMNPYFRDVQDHVIHINEDTDNMREMLGTALNANISLLSVGQSEVTRKLAGWAAILAIPTMVGGIYGMNFERMPELEWRFGYPLVLGVIALACFLVYRRLKRAGWL